MTCNCGNKKTSALEKSFRILEAVVGRQETGLTFAEIVAQTGTPKATAHRLLKELTTIGVLTFNRETAKYRGSLKLAGLGSEVMVNYDLRHHTHPELIKLRDETGHTAAMGVRSGDQGIYVDKVETTDYGIRLFSAVGKAFPLHCTGLGKVMLAHADPGEVDRILAGGLERITPNTINDPVELKKELVKTKDRGYALDLEEITRGVDCAAAPVFGPGGALIGAISVALPSYFRNERGLEPEIDAVKRYAAAVSGTIEKG